MAIGDVFSVHRLLPPEARAVEARRAGDADGTTQQRRQVAPVTVRSAHAHTRFAHQLL